MLCSQVARELDIHVRTLVPLIGELEHELSVWRARDAATAATVPPLVAALHEVAPLHEMVACLGTELVVPLRYPRTGSSPRRVTRC
jgi:hypothetical protein